jgi:lysophospholipase L1-like esterase
MRLLRWLGGGVALLFVLCLVLEIAFRLAGLVIDREAKFVDDGRTVILCVGDSHTRGRPDPDNYPAALESILNERADRPYRVVNVGIPGLSTGQLRQRFARFVDYYHPAVIMHWAGINNGWHHPEGQHGVIGWLTEHSKVARMIHVAIFYRHLLRQADATAPELLQWGGARAQWRVNFGGKEEEVVTEHGAELPVEQVAAVTRDDLTFMMQAAKERGIPMFLVKYGLAGGYFTPVNRAVIDISAEFGVPYVDCAEAAAEVHRVAPAERLYDDWVHPMPIVYKQVAEEAYGLLVERGLVKPRS